MRSRMRMLGVVLTVFLGMVPVMLLTAGVGWWGVGHTQAQTGIAITKYAPMTTATLGTVITYTLRYTIPAGETLQNVQITDCSPNNKPTSEPSFQFTGDSVGPVAVGSTPPVSEVTPSSVWVTDPTNPVGTQECLRWTLGNITNTSASAYVYTISYGVRVEESWTKNGRNEAGTNYVEMSWDGGTPIQDTTTITVARPQVDTALTVAGPYNAATLNADNAGEAVEVSGLRAGDRVTVTLTFSNVPGLNVTPAYSVIVRTHIPRWISFEQTLGATPMPSITQSPKMPDYWLLQWFAPGVKEGLVGEVSDLAILAPGRVITYAFTGIVRDDVAPASFLESLSDYRVRGFGESAVTVNEGSEFHTLPGGQGSAYAGFSWYHNIYIRPRNLVLEAGVQTGVPDPPGATMPYLRYREVATYTVVYTVPAGTVLPTDGARTYLRVSLEDGLHFGGTVLYPSSVTSGTPTVQEVSNVFGQFTEVTWFFTRSLTATTDISQTFIFTAWADMRTFIVTGTDELDWGMQRKANVTLNYLTYDGADATRDVGGSANVSFARPYFGDAETCLYRSDVEGQPCETSGELLPNEAVPVKCGGTVELFIRYVRNGDFPADDVHRNATLTAYGTVITNVLPERFGFVDAWPPTYHTTTVGNQIVITWAAEAISVPREYYLPGVVTATDKDAAPYYIVTATVPLTAAGNTIYDDEVYISYRDETGAVFIDRDDDDAKNRYLKLSMIVKIEVSKEGSGVRGGPDVRVGETVYYTVTDNVPPGLYAVNPRHEDRLPPGMQYISGTFQLVGSKLTTPTLTAPMTQLITQSGVVYEQLIWYTEMYTNLTDLSTGEPATHPLLITATYQARMVGSYPYDTETRYEGFNLSAMGRKSPLNSSLTVYWEDLNGTTLQTAPPVLGAVELHQPLLNDPRYDRPMVSVGASGPVTAVRAGDLVTYTIFVTNTGYAPAYDVVLSDTMPPGVNFREWSAAMMDAAGNSYTPTVTRTGSGQVNLWEIASVPGRVGMWTQASIRYVAQVADTVGAAASLSNTVRIMAFSGLPGDVAGEREYGTMTEYQTKRWFGGPLSVVSPTLTQEVITQVIRSVPLIYTITLPAPGIDATLYNMVLTGTVHEGLRWDGYWTSAGIATASGRVLTVTVPTIGRQQQVVVVLTTTVHPTATGILSNVVGVHWDDQAGGGVTHYLRDVALTQVLEPALALAKEASRAVVAPGQRFVYTLVYSNTGDAPAPGVLLTDTLPTGVRYLGHRTDGTRAVTLTSGPPTLVWELGDLEAGASGRLWITVTPTATLGTVVTNVVDMSTTGLGPLYTAHAGRGTRVDTTAILSLTKRAEISATTVAPAALVTYTLHYTVSGAEQALNARLVDRFSWPYLSFVAADPAPDAPPAGGVLTWTLGDVAVGVTRTVQITLRATSPLTNGLKLVNAAYVRADNALTATAVVTLPVGSAPSLSLNKVSSSPDGYIGPGETLVYTITYANSGDDYAHEVVLVDRYDATLSNVTVSPAPDISSPGFFTWTLGTLGQGARGQIVFTATVPTDKPYGYWVTNQVTMTAGNHPTLTQDVRVMVAYRLLQLSEQASAPLIPAGELVTYTLVYTTAEAYSVTLRDFYAPYVTFVQATPAPDAGDDPNDGELVWSLGDFPSSGQGTIRVTLRVASPLTHGTVLTNVSRLTAQEAAPEEASATVVVTASPQLSIVKEVEPAPLVERGATLVYTITYANRGNDYAHNVRLTEAHDPYVKITATSRPPDEAQTWLLGRLGYEPGASLVLTATVPSTIPYGYWIENVVTLTGETVEGASLIYTASARTQVAYGAPAIAKSVPPTVEAGELLTYTLVYTTGGLIESRDVVLTEHYPAGTLFVRAVPTPTTGNNVWALGTLPVGASGHITITLRVVSPLTNGTVLTNTATMTGSNVIAPATAVATTVVHSAPLFRLWKVSAPYPAVRPGKTLVYTITYANEGNEVARNARLVEHYDPVLTNISATPAPDVGNNIWTLGELAPGESGTVVVQATVPDDTAYGYWVTNWITLTSDQGEVGRSVRTVVGFTYMGFSKNAPDSVEAGELLTYTLRYTVSSESAIPLGDATLIETYPPEVAFVSATPAPDPGSGNARWSLGDLSPGTAGSVRVTVRVSRPLTDGWTLVNRAVLTSTTALSAPTLARTTVRSAPQLELEGTPSMRRADPGDTFLYTLVYRNLGNGYAENAELHLEKDPRLTFVAATLPPTTVSGDTLIWGLGNLGYTTGEPFVITVTIPTNAPKGIWLLSRAWVEADNFPPPELALLLRTRLGDYTLYLPLTVRRIAAR